ncbi:MAG: DUF2268 domain-containing putative Zn-dependent protease [Rhodospirillales bacterium]|nr:DUF2268 domain-containing putative Zn-dependent protease [Rhodospirillales bacterium]
MDRTWTLHWLQAAGSLAPWRSRIRAEIDAAFDAIARIMRPPRVDIVIHQIPHWPVPELGFGGSTPSCNTIFLGFDTSHPAMEDRLAGGLRRVVVHEAHHSMRQAGPGYGTRLAEALVSEGLADHFTLEVLGGAPDPWCLALSDGDVMRAAKAAEPVLWDPDIDLARWFRGDRRGVLPWSGYSLGWRLVDRYLEHLPDGRASALARVPAETVLALAWRDLIGTSPVSAA